MKYKVLISGGGTGGHIFPALSIANEIRRRHPDAEIKFVGAKGRMEMQRVPAAGYEIDGLEVAGFDRKRLWRNFSVLLKLWKSLRKARRIVKDFKPDVAVGVGGYASGPTLKAAQKAGVPTLLQEQNSYAGVTNKLLAAKARVICTAYDGMERFFPAGRIVKTGNPVRANILDVKESREEALKKLGFSADRPLVMVVGGSLGARSINRAMTRALPQLEKAGAQVLWQTGKGYYDEYKQFNAPEKGVRVQAFIDDMGLAYHAASIVVSRAGAGTISELQLIGKPCVLVPSPNVAEDHQTKNARALSTVGAAVLVPDAEVENTLASTLHNLLENPEQLQDMAVKIKKMALPNAAEKIVDKIEELAK